MCTPLNESHWNNIWSVFNPHWHELWKQEKFSTFAPPRGIFYKTQWAWQGVKLTWLMSIFTSQKVWKFLIEIQPTKSDSKKTGGGKCPPSCQLGLSGQEKSVYKAISAAKMSNTHYLSGVYTLGKQRICSFGVWAKM